MSDNNGMIGCMGVVIYGGMAFVLLSGVIIFIGMILSK
jgi:hypothetical protein